MPAVALSRAGARVVESDADGRAGLDQDVWVRLDALPDPRSPQGRIYPLSCLVAVVVCAMTTAGHDGLTAAGQWIKKVGPVDRARLRLPWNPWTGQYRAPDEKTIRVLLDRLDPRALTRALLGPRRRADRHRGDGAPTSSVREYRARRAAAARKALARNRIRAVAVDGKTSRVRHEVACVEWITWMEGLMAT